MEEAHGGGEVAAGGVKQEVDDGSRRSSAVSGTEVVE